MKHADKCTVCDKTFISDHELYLHKLDTLHKCEDWGYQLHSKPDAKKHMRSHKQHSCTVCKKMFFLKCSVSDHMRSSHWKKSKGNFLQDLRLSDNLEQMLEEMVEPKRETISHSKEVIDNIVRFLHGLNHAQVSRKVVFTLKMDHMDAKRCNNVDDDIDNFMSHESGWVVFRVSKKDVDTFVMSHETVGHCKEFSEGLTGLSDTVKVLQNRMNLARAFQREDVYTLHVDIKGGNLCKEVSKEIVDFVKSLNVAEVFKGGSLAKKTNIKLKSDIDLLMFLNNTTMAELKSRMNTRLIHLKELLLIFFTDLTFEPGQVTRHSIQFKLAHSESDVPHSVDLLPAVDLIADHEYGSKEAIYRKMKKDTKCRPFYSACLTKLQVDFVKDQLKTAPELRGIIRLAKHWKVKEDLLQLKSYSVELIVIKLWQDLGKPESFDLTEKFTEVMTFLSNIGNMKITWSHEYDISQFRGLPGGKPVIMDPANPYGNTAQRLKKSKTAIKRIEKRAQETLQHL